MKYEARGLIIDSENAAKPATQANRVVLDWIAGLPTNASVLDYGCGKLRYTIPLAKAVRLVSAVDSCVQIERPQIINGTRTTVRRYARAHLPNTEVYGVHTGYFAKRKYDYVLCANVLSAIPCFETRREVLHQLLKAVKPGGQILVCTQFRTTYFRKFAANPQAKRYKDGWLVTRGIRGSFYGIIGPDKLRAYCRAAGIKIVKLQVLGETAYLFGTK